MNRTFYVNGRFVPESQAVIPVTAHALHYGTGVFEGIRAYYNQKDHALYVFRLKDHYARMYESARIMFINIPFSIEALCQSTVKLLEKNFSDTDIYIRPLAFKSDPAVGNFNLKTLQDSLIIYTVPLGRYLDTEKGIRVSTSSWVRVADNAIPPRGKITGSYANAALAKTEVILNGFDEALFLDKNGHIVEGSTENVFIVKDNCLYTPPVADDILVGITRATILMLCQDELGLKVTERSIDRSEIYNSDEVFLVGTGAEVSPVVEIDRRMIGLGKIGPITKELKEIYFKMVHGELDNYRKFLTKITLKND